MKIKTLILTLFIGGSLFAQDYFPNNDGVKSQNKNYTAFTNARIFLTPKQVIENGTLLIREGKVVQAGTSVSIPANSVTIDLKGKSIYPSFIDIYSDYGFQKPKRAAGGRSPQYNPKRTGFYWNDHIMPERTGVDHFKYDDKKAKDFRNAGFGVLNTHLQDGIARGTGVLVALNAEGNDADRIVDQRSAQYFSFNRSVEKRQSYPSSLMGAMALLRQLYNDANWYAQGNASTTDRSLEALLENRNLVQIFAAGNRGNALRADGIGDAFGIQYVLLGGGDEFEDLEKVKSANARFIIPLNFPEAYDVSNPFQADYVALKDMRRWNQAPSNPKALADAGVTFAFTLHGLKSPSKFKEMVGKAIEYGLSETKALEALTINPASILGKSGTIGSLSPGRQANFTITSGDFFEKETVVYEHWIQGKKHLIEDMNQKDIRGEYTLQAGARSYALSLTGKANKPKIELKQDTIKIKAEFKYADNWVTISFPEQPEGGIYRMTGQVRPDSNNITGRMVLPDGTESTFTAVFQKAMEPEEKAGETQKEAPRLLPITYPNVGYGYMSKPQKQDILFRNATVWTNESDGILENTDVLVRDGKISRIGKDLSPGRAQVVDATGKHLTSGVIDEHSHIAALAVNESGQNSSAEVRMSDVVDPDDMDIYRNLAGGVTTIQLLHGSANPIGGRSAILRLKWGEDAAGLLFPNADKYIKFALGENVKQSNWQSFERFPQTRMGVEQVFVNYFQLAREYDNKKKSGKPYRYDEEMEVLAEILRGERYITCHSYVQSEINMLMKVAERFGFRVNTFTHILEGYKVADKMAAHGAGGSTFSDWWAYKYEVNDAIPYNAAIMASQGVVVAINSDDAEMSRRLNQEAAKTMKYGGMSEEEAWKTVTLNPAKHLHLDDRVGSIRAGKDADLVLWTDHPMSVYAKAEKTLIEGAVYFDLEKDRQQREAIKKERSELIEMMLKEKDKGGNTQKPVQKKKERFVCKTDQTY